MPDRADGVSRYAHRGLRHTLNHRSHAAPFSLSSHSGLPITRWWKPRGIRGPRWERFSFAME
jgi:hypothetical protein